jgi:hypothetical protein
VTRSLASADFCADGVRTSALLSWGREKLEQRFGLANLYAPWMIQSKCGNGSPTNWCLADDTIPVPTKMDLPVIHTRMKQSNLEASIRVDYFDAVGLAPITETPHRLPLKLLAMDPQRHIH